MTRNKRLETGVPALDDQLGGGIPPGAIVTLSSDPRTQSEMFIHKLASKTDTLYISTIGNEQTVKAEFAKSTVTDTEPSVVDVSVDSPVQEIRKHIEKAPEQSLIIINSVNELENASITKRGAYQKLINHIQNLNLHTGTIVILHRFARGEGVNEHEMVTNSISDIIIELDQEVTGEDITDYLHMPKCRGGIALDQRLQLDIGANITVDTSRDIA